MTELVACRRLVYRAGGHLVLNNLELTLLTGESLALLGASGSGKTSLLRIIAGLDIPEHGEVHVGGLLASRDGQLTIPPHRRRLAMLFQDLGLWPNLTVADNVRLGLAGLRLPRPAIRTRISETLELCGIRDLADRLPGTLSGGQQQRAALARALATRPQLLLLDEPFTGLDLLTKQSIVQELAKLKSELGLALILVTHDAVEVHILCDSLAVLEDGCIVDRRLLRDVEAAPRSMLAHAFMNQLRKLT